MDRKARKAIDKALAPRGLAWSTTAVWSDVGKIGEALGRQTLRDTWFPVYERVANAAGDRTDINRMDIKEEVARYGGDLNRPHR